MPSPLITVDELHAALTASRGIRVLDVRWRLDRPEGRPDYLDGHIPSAVYVDLESDLAERGDPSEGRHPVPGAERLQRAARRWGLEDGQAVVVYDDLDAVAAARAWWVLRQAGVDDVRVLDGGLRAWTAAGHPLEPGDVTPRRGGGITLTAPDGALTADEAARVAERGVLIDVRHRRLYRGDDDPHDPVAGHIPGARNLPTTVHVENGSFRSPERIRANFALVGAVRGVDIAAYCGSGVASAHTVLAGEIAGLRVDLFAASWSHWSRSRGRRYAVGSSPAGLLLPI